MSLNHLFQVLVNFGEPLVNGNGEGEVDGSELETDILSSPLKSKVIFYFIRVCFQEKKNLLCMSWKTKVMRLRKKQQKYMKKKSVYTLMREAKKVSLKICEDDKLFSDR